MSAPINGGHSKLVGLLYAAEEVLDGRAHNLDCACRRKIGGNRPDCDCEIGGLLREMRIAIAAETGVEPITGHSPLERQP